MLMSQVQLHLHLDHSYYGGAFSDAFLIDVTLNGNDCADNGKTVDCYTGIDQTAFGGGIPEIYYGAYANSLAYRQGVDSLGNPTQIPEQGVTVTASF